MKKKLEKQASDRFLHTRDVRFSLYLQKVTTTGYHTKMWRRFSSEKVRTAVPVTVTPGKRPRTQLQLSSLEPVLSLDQLP